jgi:hypothetical protein
MLLRSRDARVQLILHMLFGASGRPVRSARPTALAADWLRLPPALARVTIRSCWRVNRTAGGVPVSSPSDRRWTTFSQQC